jgi:hypothetical protein
MTVFIRSSSRLLSTLSRLFFIRSTLLIRIAVEIHVAHSNPNRLAVADRTCTITDDHQIFCWPLGQTEFGNDGGIVFSELSLEDDKVDSISVSDTHVCVLTISGQARCALLVGLRSGESKTSLFEGQWLHGPMHQEVRQICAGSFFTCAILKSVRGGNSTANPQ